MVGLAFFPIPVHIRVGGKYTDKYRLEEPLVCGEAKILCRVVMWASKKEPIKWGLFLLGVPYR